MDTHSEEACSGIETARNEEFLTSPEMLSILRHELRTPINAIIGYSEMWLEEDSVKETPSIHADIEKMLQAGRQLQSLVSDILDPARFDLSAGLDVRGLGVVLRHAFRMPACAVLGYNTVLAESADVASRIQLHADLGRIEAATHDLLAQAEALATSGRLPERRQGRDPAAPLHDHVRAMATRFRSAGRQRAMLPAVESGRILVVDDNEYNSDPLSRGLQRLGYSVAVASDGITALRLIEQQDFDLVLLDVVMPVMNGLEVLKCLRCTYSVTALPVIMITARDEIDDIVLALENGANDYLAKPFALPVVVARVRTQLLLKQMIGELEHANHKLETLSLRDELTQLANRRSFDDAFSREKRRAQREGKPLSLALVDIDYFKNYNDTFGHEAGDATLRRVANAIAHSVGRGSDVAFRYGGEEFAVLLPDTDAEGALRVAERIRETVECLAIPSAGSAAACVTVSIGVATAMPSSAEQLATLFEHADQALYRAKSEGRNSVCYLRKQAARKA